LPQKARIDGGLGGIAQTGLFKVFRVEGWVNAEGTSGLEPFTQ
jgi:hypothetical protein